MDIRRNLSMRAMLALALGLAACGGKDTLDEAVPSDTATTSAATTTDVERSNEELVRRFYRDVYDGGDTAQIDAIISASYIEHSSPTPMQQGARDSLKKFIAAFRTAFPDVRTTIEHVVARGDMVFAHYRQTGTSKAEFMGMPATGRAYDVHGVDVIRIVDGQAVEHWGYSEDMKMMSQVGWEVGGGASE